MKKIHLTGLIFLLIIKLHNVYAADNLKFNGELVKEACNLSAETTVIPLNFGSIPDTFIYNGTKLRNVNFQIKLINCDVLISKSVRIAMKGPESGEMPGYLAVPIDGKASGVAIGILNKENNLIKINSDGNLQQLTPNTTSFDYSAFIVGEPTAIKEKSIERGAFDVSLSFSMSYE